VTRRPPVGWAVAALALAGCGVPTARHAALADAFDAAAAARDRAQAELDVCTVAAADRAEADRVAAAPARAAVEVLDRLAPAVGGSLASDGSLVLDPALWFRPGTADLADEAGAAFAGLAAGLAALPPGVVVVAVAVGEVPPSREYPTALHLAADRAIALVEGLRASGLPAERLSAVARAGAPSVALSWAPVPR
jgi:hypothetical protein